MNLSPTCIYIYKTTRLQVHHKLKKHRQAQTEFIIIFNGVIC